ncbi:MAG: aminotransferase class V-fold PLP-dependent enzyme [Thermomicrobiales bacterium]|nr:aminotransferase class V-fold PLP-dependent enzyme [Thermomicrobiales bacterium]
MEALAVRMPVEHTRPPATSHQSAPMLDALDAYLDAGTISFSTPGHKSGRLIDDELRRLLGDPLFRADVWLNTSRHDTALRAAERLAADAWGAGEAFFTVNGSSSGNQAVLLALLGPGDKVIVARDAHMSVLSGLILTGAEPVFVSPTLHPEQLMSTGVTPASIETALAQHPDAKLVVLTSPTYHGVASDLPAIVAAAHARQVPVMVDEAWGAHFPFHQSLPIHAMAAGADVAVVSLHKTLPTISQGAMIVTQGNRIDRGRFKSSVRMTQTTSRCLPILASIDSARRQVALHGWGLLELTLALAALTRRRLQETPGIVLIDETSLGIPASRFDPTRLVIDTGSLGLNGYQVESILREEFGIAPELSDGRGIVCVVTVGDTRASLDALVDALTAIATRPSQRSALRPRVAARSVGDAIAQGELSMLPRDAFFARSRSVPLPTAIGCIAAEPIIPYPPGIPVLVPGERICWNKLLYLAQIAASGAICAGAADPRLLTIRVVDETVGS